MNQKAFAIFIGLIMIFSAFAGIVMMGGDNTREVTPSNRVGSLDDFGVSGRLIDWPFDCLGDVLEMCPEDLVLAYWIDLDVSQNLTDSVRATLPPSFGVSYGDNLYPSPVEKACVAFLEDDWAEFHWMRPASVRYQGLVIPYEGFMLIPWSSDYSTVMGRPTLFGPQRSLESIIDVVNGGYCTDRFTLPYDKYADLQVASLGRSYTKDSTLPMGGGYGEFYLGVSQLEDGFMLTAKCLSPDSSTDQKLREVAGKYGLQLSSNDGILEISGLVEADKLESVLSTLLGP